MEQQPTLGAKEAVILMAVLVLGEDAYGASIWREVQDITGAEESLGALMTTLDRLEEKGFVTSWIGEPTAVRGGRRKRYFRIEADGRAAIDEFEREEAARQQRWQRVRARVPGFGGAVP